MPYLEIAVLLAALIMSVPLVFSTKHRPSLAAGGCILALFLWWLLWASNASLVGPFFGSFGVILLSGWLSVGVVTFLAKLSGGDDAPKIILPLVPGVVLLILFVGRFFFGTGIVQAGKYQALIGSVQMRDWTKDIQPKDPRHMRMVDLNNAIYRARKVIGQDGTIGSQFQVNDAEFTLQIVDGTLWYVAPLEFSSFSVWSSDKVSPGYVMVSAENPDLPPKLVKFAPGHGMRYSPSAFFDHNLERHLRLNGYITRGLAQMNFEVDDQGQPWWVATVYTPTIAWWGNRVDGVAIVDPSTGADRFYPLGHIPGWVDRAVPGGYAMQYIAWWGQYRHGWWNSVWAKRDLVQPGHSILVYGNDNQPEFVTDITSSNRQDNSLVGVMYTNSRTGKSVYYAIGGGGTDEAILEAVDTNQDINFRHLHGSTPQLYNLDGTLASVVPLFNNSSAYQGVAIVPVNNVQEVAFGDTQFAALAQYEKYLSDKGIRAGFSKDRNLQTLVGIVDRIASYDSSTGSIFYLHVAGVPHLFTGGIGISPKLAVTEKGDKVRLTYYDSSVDVVPMNDFDDLSLPLSQSDLQKTLRQDTEADRKATASMEPFVTNPTR